ncbi:hypothetical protein [Paracoccus laeviglucosivorans]|uniref:Uncharacterized protein n=1 Tax=Paracoccus laeviglucosivorans TaxID=1197861 RepID=A0A521FQC8_9RHOB|nr:hypothetical protein [Paracoccus laeviglucosivorans]SMO97740.1 hypothetical protein SAMN06265221_12920 [Paracoccus laeviglucosivorans]
MQPEHVQYLLDLPLDTLASLVAGYLGYRIAYTGRDTKHGTLDVLFITFAFAFIAKTTFFVATAYEAKSWVLFGSYALGLCLAIGAACVWRKWLMDRTFKVLRATGVSAADRCTTAWESMLHRSRSPQRLVVRKKNGERMMTLNLADFTNAPLGTCLLGEDGSVGMYVTDIMHAGTTEWEERQVFDPAKPDWGYDMTFIPASEILEVRISLHDADSLKAGSRHQETLIRKEPSLSALAAERN